MTLARCPHCGEAIQLSKPKAMQAKFDHDAALALLKMGASQTEVAEAFGVSRQAVSYLKKRSPSERVTAFGKARA